MINQGNDQPAMLTVVQIEVTGHGYPEPHRHVTRVYTPEAGRASNRMWFPSDLANTRADKPIIVADLALGGTGEVIVATCPICRTDFFQLPDGVSHSIPGYVDGLDIPEHAHATKSASPQGVPDPPGVQGSPLPQPEEIRDPPIQASGASVPRTREHSPVRFIAATEVARSARVAPPSEVPSTPEYRPEYPYNITDWRESLAESLAEIIGIAGYNAEVESAQTTFYQDYITGVLDEIADELEMEAAGIEFSNVSDTYTFPSLLIVTDLHDLLYYIYCEGFAVRSTLEIVQNTGEPGAEVDDADQISVDGPLHTRRGPVMIDVEGVPVVDADSLTDAIQKDLSSKLSAWLAEYRKRNPA